MIIINSVNYLELQQRLFDMEDPPVKYKKQVFAKKSHVCEKCRCEIHPNELCWWWKPRPKYNKLSKKKRFYKWRTRCMDCEPKRQSELDLYYER